MSRLTVEQKRSEEANIKARAIRKQELDDIRAVLSNAAGKRLVWRIMERCGTFRSTYNSDVTRMSYLSGQQDLGRFIMSEVIATDENLYLKLIKANKKGEGNE